MTAAEDRATAAQSPHISNLGCCMLLPASLNQTHGMRLSLVMMSRIVFTALVLASIVLAAGTAIGPQLEGRAPLDQSPQQEKQAGLRTVTITEICPSSTSSIQTPRTHLSHGLFPNPLEADTSAAAAEMDLARNHPSLPASAAVDSPTKRTLPYFIQCPEGWTWLSRHCATHSKHAWKDLCRDDRYGSEVYHMCEKWQKCAKGEFLFPNICRQQRIRPGLESQQRHKPCMLLAPAVHD